MTELTRQFCEVPFEVFPNLVQQPLLINVPGHNNPDQAVAHSYRDRGGRTASLRALDRVAWASMALVESRHVVTISRTYGELEDAEPCYYLPWIPDRTLGMKLKPSRKLAEQDRFDAYGDRLGVDAGALERATAQRQMLQQIENAEHRAPRLFFTAMLTGCSVHIDGLATEPNVYHGNATRKADPPGATASKDLPTRKRFQGRMRRIEGSLDAAHQRMSWNEGGETSCVSALDYDFRLWRNEILAPKWGHGADLLTEQLRQEGAQVKRMEAVVFGVRRRGNDEWVFYGQRVYQYRLANFDTGALGYPPRQIWPGHGHIQL